VDLAAKPKFWGWRNSSREGGKKMSDPSAAGVVPQILFAGISMIIAASPTFARLIHDSII